MVEAPIIRDRRIRLGMVGGGEGAFIGAVHRIAARLDDEFILVAGALSSDPARAAASAVQLGLSADRSYASYAEMAHGEAARADGIEAVAIVTPNDLHVPVARAFLEAGIHVICDKPLATSLAEGSSLAAVAQSSGRIFALTHNYTGYPMVRQSRAMVAGGVLDKIRIIQARYAQDWLTTKLEDAGSKQAEWRTDPARSGAGGALGDIGTHAFNLACFVSGLVPASLCAELTTFVPGRRLDDDVQILLRYAEGARGMIWASQVAVGNTNNLTLGIYGEKAGLEWHQERPEELWFTPFGEPKRLLTRGGPGIGPEAARLSRIPAGHPEGYLEGFANIYGEIARAIRAARDGGKAGAEVMFPTLADGTLGMAFIEAAVRSSKAGGVWVGLME